MRRALHMTFPPICIGESRCDPARDARGSARESRHIAVSRIKHASDRLGTEKPGVARALVVHPLLVTTTGRSTPGIAIDATLPATHRKPHETSFASERATTTPREGP